MAEDLFLRRFGRAFDHAGSDQNSPLDRGRDQAVPAPVLGQRVEHCVGRSVIGLARRSEHARDRRKHDEMIECQLARGFVQIPSAERLGVADFGEAFGRHRRQRSVVEDHRRVKHARNPRGRPDLVEQSAYRRSVAHIAALDADRGSPRA